jgi:hypothetical protein
VRGYLRRHGIGDASKSAKGAGEKD